MYTPEMTAAMSALHELEEKQSALSHAMGMIYFDATTVAPRGTAENRGHTLGILSSYMYELTADPKNKEFLDVLAQHADELEYADRRRYELVQKGYDRIGRIPQDEYVEYNVLLNDAQTVWEQAKNENDFPRFAPYLEKIVAFNRKFAGYYNPDLAPYDALLNEYEEGLTMPVLDEFFAKLRATIVPLLSKIAQKAPVDDGFLFQSYPIDTQRKFSDLLMEVLLIDRDHCGIAETEHPYTCNFSNQDVRITTHYHECDLASSMYSVIHEGGHAIYELGCADEYNHTALAGGVSMSIHESQSRFFENIIGRSRAFIARIYPALTELFPEQLRGISAEDFYRAVNRAQPSLIRTEADELTYCLHIMVRYELEKRLIDGSLSVADVPAEWNRLYKEYLGIDVPDDTHGCLQDSHWSGGSFGYFPSYALGSAYAAQMLHAIEADMGSVETAISEGKLGQIKAWLGEKIHRHGCLYRPGELLESACGRFDAKYYTDYLTRKFSALYELS